MDLGLTDRVVFVSGGSRGIGRAAVLAFAREGARVAFTHHTERDRADALVAELRAAGGEAMTARLDLADHDTVRAAVGEVIARWGAIDVLVNNAVRWASRPPWDAPPFEHVDPSEWRPVLESNVEGHITAIQAALPGMRARGWGRIVNVSSGIAVDGLPGAGAYGAAKAALHGLTRTLARELGPAGILVNVVTPGLTLTERVSARLAPAMRDQMASTSHIRRLLGPEEVVPTIVFLGSGANTAVTGEVVRASGGAT